MTQDFSRHEPSPGAVDGVDLQQLNALNTIGTISYVLHLIVAVAALIPGGQFGPILLIAALLIDLIKRDNAAGTWQASHFRWRIRTVIIAGLLYLLTAPLFLLFYIPGALAWLLISIWFLYRIVTGLVRMNKGRPMEFSA
jgi:uncharacterized membrane protein